VDLVPGHEGPDRRQRSDHVDRRGIEADLLLRLAKRGGDEVRILLIAAPAGKGDLPGVAAKVGAPLGEDEARALRIPVERQQNGGVRSPWCAQRPGLDGVQKPGAEPGGSQARTATGSTPPVI
jgi:hypothetical protein